MIDKINENIEAINSNIEVLPRKTKKNLEKVEEYLDDSISKYKYLLEKDLEEINSRRDAIFNKYNTESYQPIESNMDYDSIKLSDPRAKSSEKLNLDYLFYNLEHSNNNLDDVNNTISTIISNFRNAGIGLSEADFNYNTYVNTYIRAILGNKDNIQDVFNDIYWKDSDVLKQVELNVRYLYYKNESKLDDYFKTKFATFDFSKFIHEHKNKILNESQRKHDNSKYNFDLFYNKEVLIDEYMNENKKIELLQSIFVNMDNPRNYENLVKLKKSLYEFKEYKRFEYIINDFKGLYEHKAEYKDLLSNKLKDIAKKEKTVQGIIKKVNRTGFFRPSPNKIVALEAEKGKILSELLLDYDDVDELKIKDTIFKHVTDETTYYDIFKLTTYNFNYFVSLIRKENKEITPDEIKASLDELQKYIYDNYVDIIDNIKISDTKDISKIICDKYQLNDITVDTESLSLDAIDKYIENIGKAILFFDIERLNIDLEGIKFLLDSDDIVKKID